MKKNRKMRGEILGALWRREREYDLLDKRGKERFRKEHSKMRSQGWWRTHEIRRLIGVPEEWDPKRACYRVIRRMAAEGLLERQGNWYRLPPSSRDLAMEEATIRILGS